MTVCWCGREYIRESCPVHGTMRSPYFGGAQENVEELIAASRAPSASFSLTLPGQTSHTAGTWTGSSGWTVVSLDGCTEVGSGMISIGQGGLWLLSAETAWTSNAATGYVAGTWRKMTSITLSLLRIWSGANYSTVMQEQVIVPLVAGNVIYHYTAQDRGSGQTTVEGGCHLRGVLL